MHINNQIEDIVARELKSLCTDCAHATSCIYYQTSTKKIIQCELYTMDYDAHDDTASLNGLCRTCDLSASCRLSGRKAGVWHCSEYK